MRCRSRVRVRVRFRVSGFGFRVSGSSRSSCTVVGVGLAHDEQRLAPLVGRPQLEQALRRADVLDGEEDEEDGGVAHVVLEHLLAAGARDVVVGEADGARGQHGEEKALDDRTLLLGVLPRVRDVQVRVEAVLRHGRGQRHHRAVVDKGEAQLAELRRDLTHASADGDDEQHGDDAVRDDQRDPNRVVRVALEEERRRDVGEL